MSSDAVAMADAQFGRLETIERKLHRRTSVVLPTRRQLLIVGSLIPPYCFSKWILGRKSVAVWRCSRRQSRRVNVHVLKVAFPHQTSSVAIRAKQFDKCIALERDRKSTRLNSSH